MVNWQETALSSARTGFQFRGIVKGDVCNFSDAKILSLMHFFFAFPFFSSVLPNLVV